MNRLKLKQLHCDSILLAVTIILVLIGLVMVFSSSGVYAMEKYNDAYYFLKRQVVWAALGAIIMLSARKMDYRNLEKYTYYIMGLVFLMLLAVMIPGFGKEVGGAKAWFDFGIFGLQPAEFAKYGTILAIAKFIHEYSLELHKLKNLIKTSLFLGIPIILILQQPDAGSALIYTSLFLVFFI